MADGSRKLTMIREIQGYRDGNPIRHPLFRFHPTTVSSNLVTGDFWQEGEPSDALVEKLARWAVMIR